jgi:hypothetical protein
MSLISMRAPGLGGVIDDLEQPLVDGIAVGQQFVQVHRSHDGTDVGQGQVGDGLLQIGHLIGRLRRVQHLVEGNAVHPHHGVVLGDDLLARDVQHLLLHGNAITDTVHERGQDVQARLQRARVTPEAFDGIVGALRHHLDGGVEQDQQEQEQNNDGDRRQQEYQVHDGPPGLEFGFEFTRHI